MRKIKFRAWDGKKMYLPEYTDREDFHIEADGTIVFTREYGFERRELTNRRDDNWILMQFTGLLDKNGKEIYEGDILRLLETISTDDPAYPYYCDTMEVCYCEPLCRFGLTDGGAILDIPSNVEVIGNKFENPDLC